MRFVSENLYHEFGFNTSKNYTEVFIFNTSMETDIVDALSWDNRIVFKLIHSYS